MRTYSVTQGTQCGRADGNGKKFQKKRGNTYKHRADSLCYIAETNTTL